MLGPVAEFVGSVISRLHRGSCVCMCVHVHESVCACACVCMCMCVYVLEHMRKQTLTTRSLDRTSRLIKFQVQLLAAVTLQMTASQ